MAIEKETNRNYSTFEASIAGATQGDGAVEIDVSGAQTLNLWQIQVNAKGSPANGALSVAYQPPESSAWYTFPTQINLVDGPFAVAPNRPILAGKWRFTPENFDGDSYDVELNAS